MVPLIATSNLALSAALRKRIAESCPRDLSKAFMTWLLEDFDEPTDLLSIVAQAAKRDGAGQDFQTVAILGFAAAAGVVSEPEVAALKKGLSRLAGRSPVVSGVRMPFCADAVGILGIALGTAAIANAEVTGEVVGWAMRFLKSAYERDRAEDWQRCLLAAADLKMRTPLALPFPNSAAAADVRLALLAKGLINCSDTQVRQDAARVLKIPVQEPLGDVDCERAALHREALEWVSRTPTAATDNEKRGSNKRSELKVLRADSEGTEEGRKSKRPPRRNQKYKSIDKALQAIAESRPSTQEEIFQSLEGRNVVIPPAHPFTGARGWITGFNQDKAAARAWLSKRWAELGLPALPRGPKNPKK